MKMEEKGRKESKSRDNKQDEGRNRYIYELKSRPGLFLSSHQHHQRDCCLHSTRDGMGRCAFKGDPSSPSTALSVLERTSIVV